MLMLGAIWVSKASRVIFFWGAASEKGKGGN